MLSRDHLDRIHVAFDDHRLVANAGLILPVTLAQHLGLRELVDNHLDLGDAPGRANTGDKMLTLVASALAGGDCIDDADVLRTGGAGRVGLRGQGAVYLGDLPTQLPVEPRANSTCVPTAASTPTPWSPSAARWMSASPSPSASTPVCGISSRPYPRKSGRPSPIVWMAPPTWPRLTTRPSRANPTP